MFNPDTTPYRPDVRPALPGKAVGAAVVGLAYGALSVIGIFQILAVIDDLRPSDQSIASISIAITVLIIGLLFVGGWLVLRNTTRVPLLVGASISMFLAVFSVQQGIGLFTLINLGASVAMVLLLNSAEVKNHFRR